MFPRIIPISDLAKGLLSKIFKLNPVSRPSLEEIESNEFFQISPIDFPKESIENRSNICMQRR